MTLRNLLATANGRRRVRILDLADLERLIQRAKVADDGWNDWVSGGTVCGSYSYPAQTTVAAVARIDGVVYLGVSTGSARNSLGSPAIAWSEWKSMRQASPSRRTEKLRAWVEHHLGDSVFEANDLVASPVAVECLPR